MATAIEDEIINIKPNLYKYRSQKLGINIYYIQIKINVLFE